jgi:hypothetical protein
VPGRGILTSRRLEAGTVLPEAVNRPSHLKSKRDDMALGLPAGVVIHDAIEPGYEKVLMP